MGNPTLTEGQQALGNRETALSPVLASDFLSFLTTRFSLLAALAAMPSCYMPEAGNTAQTSALQEEKRTGPLFGKPSVMFDSHGIEIIGTIEGQSRMFLEVFGARGDLLFSRDFTVGPGYFNVQEVFPADTKVESAVLSDERGQGYSYKTKEDVFAEETAN